MSLFPVFLNNGDIVNNTPSLKLPYSSFYSLSIKIELSKPKNAKNFLNILYNLDKIFNNDSYYDTSITSKCNVHFKTNDNFFVFNYKYFIISYNSSSVMFLLINLNNSSSYIANFSPKFLAVAF